MIDWTRNPALEEELFARLRLKYDQDRTKEIHFSDTIYCLTKSYWGKTNPIPVDRLTMGLFAVGLALEDVLLKPYPSSDHIHKVLQNAFKQQDRDPSINDLADAVVADLKAPVIPPYLYEGVHFSPDYFTTITGGEMDLKTTRMWSDPDGRPKRVADRPHGFPETWLKQFMGYAHRFGAQPANDQCDVDYVDYSVGILYIMSGELVAGTIRFDWEEVELNMAHHLHRAAILEDQLSQGVPPVPFMYNDAWECKNCPYLSRCKTTEVR